MGSVRVKFSICQMRSTGPGWNLVRREVQSCLAGYQVELSLSQVREPAGAGIILTLMLKNYDKYDTILMPLNPADRYEPPFWIVKVRD